MVHLGFVQLVNSNDMRKFIILILLSFQVVSCQNRTIKITPNEFLSKVKVPKDLYAKDSLKLVDLIKEQIKNHKEAYYPKAYDSLTVVVIDTIMYSKDLSKITFFIIDKVENKKTYPKGWNEEDVKSVEKYGNLPYEGYHYNAKAYIGVRKNDSIEIANFFRLEVGDFLNISELKIRQRQMFFEEYSAVKEKGFEYNLDDYRFWDNPNVWDYMKRDN